MALPPRAAAVYVKLSKDGENGTVIRPVGTTINSPVLVSLVPGEEYVPPAQPNFWASQMWYQTHPAENVARVHLGLVDSFYYQPSIGTVGNRIYPIAYTDNVEVDSTFPANIVYDYTPAPGGSDPVPDPNGTVGTYTTPKTSPTPYQIYPRWAATDTAYDIGNAQTGAGSFCPVFDTEYYIGPTGFFSTAPYGRQVGAWSVDVTVENFQSEVYNNTTSTYEYYDFAQTTFDYKQTTTVKMYLDTNVCCWNNGTVINGTVSFQAITVECTALGRTLTVNPDPSYSYGFAGLIATTGSSASAAGTQSFTVTVSSSYVPVEIEIPTVSGAITFLNDFRIDSVTPPA
jgi:hypothetical protein